MTRDGVTTIASSETYWTNPFFDTIAQALEAGSLDVDGVIALLRQDGRPVYTKVADWIERRGGTSNVTAQMLVGVLTSITTLAGAQIAAGDDPEPVNEQQIERIVEHVLEEHEKSSPDAPPVSVDVDVNEGGKGDVTVKVDVQQPPG